MTDFTIDRCARRGRGERDDMGSAHSTSWTVCVPLSFHVIAFGFLWWKQRKGIKAERLVFEKIGHVAGIFIYPVKSCKGISLNSANCLIEGLESDRFVSSRKKNDSIVEILVL